METVKPKVGNIPVSDPGILMRSLDWIYEKALYGTGGIESATDLANDYLNTSKNLEEAISSLIRWQIAKSATAGFLSSVGGLITLAVTLPVNIASVLFVQIRMIIAIAIMTGLDPKSDQVKSLVFVSLTGNAASNLLKGVGVTVGQKLTSVTISKISGQVLININKMVGFRLLTKAGRTGIINLGKAIPFVGGIVGGAVDATSTRIIGRTAKQIFAS